MDKRLRLSELDRKVDEIVRDEKKSDYEKKLLVMDVMIDLLDEIEELEKKVSDYGWEREYEHRDDWKKVYEMGC